MSTLGFIGSLVSTLRVNWRPQVVSKRFRYWADRKPYARRHGYEDKAFYTGLLPRKRGADRIVELPIYRPKDNWNQRRSLFGQNDYIDILGDGNINPVKIMYEVPPWLRGFSGNELQRLIRKKKLLGGGSYPKEHPKRWRDMNTRIKWLWYELNYRRKISRALH